MSLQIRDTSLFLGPPLFFFKIFMGVCFVFPLHGSVGSPGGVRVHDPSYLRRTLPPQAVVPSPSSEYDDDGLVFHTNDAVVRRAVFFFFLHGRENVVSPPSPLKVLSFSPFENLP